VENKEGGGGALVEKEPIRYAAAACQVDRPNPTRRAEIGPNVDRMLEMVDMAVEGYEPMMDVRLVVFPEFAHAAPVYPTAKALCKHLTLPIPNDYTEQYTKKAKEHNIYIQTGTFLEARSEWPGKVFNSTCLIGPEGILYTYRKVNPWIPWEVHTSPHDLSDYRDELFPVAQTPIGGLGVAICYDWLFPEVLRQLVANGAEVLIRVSAYMDPWGATPPMDWWTTVNRCRALENMSYVVAANQGASLANYAPFSWPGGSMVVDYDGRVLAQADPGPGEKIVVAPIDIGGLRYERKRRMGHQPLGHMRTEAYPLYGRSFMGPGQMDNETNHTMEINKRRIMETRSRIDPGAE